MGFWLNFGIFMSFLITVVLAVVLVVLRFYKDEELEKDRPFAINFMSHYCDGCAYGVEKEIVKGKGGRYVITMSQRDLPIDKMHLIKDEKVIVDKNKILTLPKGSFSKNKNINIYLPPSASDFPDTLKDTEFGKALMMLTEIKNAVNDEIEAVKEGSSRKSELLKRIGDGELSREHLITIDEIVKDIVKMVAETKKDRTQTSYTPITGSGGSLNV